jgi:type IV pilus assembly protein PilY1
MLSNIRIPTGLQLIGLSASLCWTAASAAPGTLADSPLFLSDAVPPNVIMALDDSGSMDSEVLMPTNDGALWFHTGDRSFVGRNISDALSPGSINYNSVGAANDTWKKYVYLFPNGFDSGNRTGATRTYEDATHAHFAVPPTPEYAFARSSAYNKAYYDPNITYKPWVPYSNASFGDVNPTQAPWDPIANATTFTVDLTSDINVSSGEWEFKLWPGMRDANGNIVLADEEEAFSYFPSTYYVPEKALTMSVAGVALDCSNPLPTNYAVFEAAPNLAAGTADAIGPDGACLKRYEIRLGNSFPSGRSYAAELQNFANWFTYYRKRHQAMRGGMARAFNNISGVRSSLFRFNSRNDLTMLNLTTQKDAFLDDIYNARGAGGTPTRESLVHIGQQYERTGAGAPVIEACQKNYGIIFTDGFATTHNPGVGNVDGAAGAPYQDAFSNTLADVAMDLYENLNVTGFASGKVPVAPVCASNPDPALDCNRDLHVNTFGVTLNAQGNIFGVTHQNVRDAYLNPPAWLEPNLNRNPRMVDDMYHAAVNGRGEMLNARTPDEIETKITEVLDVVIATEGTAASVTFNTGLLSNDSVVFQSRFNSRQWSGFLTATDLDPITGALAATAAWDASALIPTQNSRQISTYNPGTGGVPFRTVANLSATQQIDLATNLPAGRSAQDVLDYLRGSRTYEGAGGFRERDPNTVLGDIIHSGPVFVGKPESNWPTSAPFPTGADSYQNFRNSAVQNRREAVYVGSNDGMLHGFWGDVGSVDSGAEFMAYVPHDVASTTPGEGLHALADPNYSHRYYVDLTPVVADAFVKTTPVGNPSWRTVLLGGLRGGGRGYFALDVTDPTALGEANAANFVLWEFSSDDDADLGYTYSDPTISLMNNGRWAAVFGNGYNNTGSGQAALFVVFLDGGLDGTWTLGTDYVKILVPGANNGLATPQLADLDNDGTPDRAYAGDLAGKMWAFDLSGANTNNGNAWGIAHSQGGSDMPLFTALDSNGNAQPITSKPVLARCPYDNSAVPDVMVLFGTGQYIVNADKSDTSAQTFYGVWDKGDGLLDRTDLVQQLANDPTLSYDTTLVRVPTDNPVDATNYGWHMDMPDAGERIVSNPLVRSDIVFFNTIVPVANDPCSIGGGGWLMSLDVCSGGRPDAPIFDLNRDGVVDGDDAVVDRVAVDANGNPVKTPAGGERFNTSEGLPWQSSILSDIQYTPGSTGTIENRSIDLEEGTLDGRLSWEQLIDD